jgi:indolepyruvate ferredoxin oxidoreductase
VITVGALMGMAAHLEGKGASVLDMTGMSQKNGSVTSHVKIAETPERLRAQRIATGEADLVLGCDMLTAGAADAISKMRPGRTTGRRQPARAADRHLRPAADWEFPAEQVRSLILEAVGGEAGVDFIDATKLATALMGDSIAANLFMMGYAWQKGLHPAVGSVAAARDRTEWRGRRVEQAQLPVGPPRRRRPQARREDRDAGAGHRGADAAEPGLRHQEARRVPDRLPERRLCRAVRRAGVARCARPKRRTAWATSCRWPSPSRYFKLMAYKDEYEVARLYTDGRFVEQLKASSKATSA